MTFAAVPPSTPAPESEPLAAPADWSSYRAEVADRLAPSLGRAETRQRALAYIDGLLSGAERKNGWQLAEIHGDRDPYGIQYLLGRARWSVTGAREALCHYVRDHLEDPQGVLVCAERGFVKKGTHSAGVARQYCNTAGRRENCQIGMFLAYAGPRGCTLLDAALYLPRPWTDAPDRLQAVGLAPDTPYATKPELVQQLLDRVGTAGVSAAWVMGDMGDSHSLDLRAWLEARSQAYVLAVPQQEAIGTGPESHVVAKVYEMLAAEDWHQLGVGTDSQDECEYDWQVRVLEEPVAGDWRRHLLFRRQRQKPGAWQAYVAFAPPSCDSATLVRVVESRSIMESTFGVARDEVGLEDYEVRKARGWECHMILALWALALLGVVRAASLPMPPVIPKPAGPSSLAAFKQTRGLAGT